MQGARARVRIRFTLIAALSLLTGCAHMPNFPRMPWMRPKPDPWLGTWRLATYELWDEKGARQLPLGDEPSGYIVLDETGRAFVQIMRPGMVGSFGAYYGTFMVDTAKKQVRITVEGGSAVEYFGTVQERPYRIVADTLVLGVEREYRATFIRVRPPPARK
jgi:hypothetical protein